MNIAIISSNSSYHQLANRLKKESNVNTVLHYGASPYIQKENNYIPVNYQLPTTGLDKGDLENILSNIKNENIKLVLASGLAIPSNDAIHHELEKNQIPYFFVNKELTSLEKNKSLTKKMLNFLNIPTGEGFTTNGQYLFEKFKTIPRPFVIKLNLVFQYGRQTTIVNDDNFEDVYIDLFSNILGMDIRITNINLDTSLIIEKYIRIKKEFSYHCIMNDKGWQYFGSARDYKTSLDNNLGFNTVGMGSYNIKEIDNRVHEYVDKIFNFLKSKNYRYKGFMYLGIAIDYQDNIFVLEINTRSGDPELNSILDSIDNNLSEIFYLAATDQKIPELQFNDNKIVTVRIINSKNWLEDPIDLPKFKDIPEDIFYGIESGDDIRVKHSHFTAIGKTHAEAGTKIYNFLNKQNLGQYYYRKDIGILD